MKMAVARPAAPAPTIAISHDSGSSGFSERELTAFQSREFDVRAAPATTLELSAPVGLDDSSGFAMSIRDRSPHELQRTVTVFPSSDRPTICVRCAPHFGQIGGGS